LELGFAFGFKELLIPQLIVELDAVVVVVVWALAWAALRLVLMPDEFAPELEPNFKGPAEICRPL